MAVVGLLGERINEFNGQIVGHYFTILLAVNNLLNHECQCPIWLTGVKKGSLNYRQVTIINWAFSGNNCQKKKVVSYSIALSICFLKMSEEVKIIYLSFFLKFYLNSCAFAVFSEFNWIPLLITLADRWRTLKHCSINFPFIFQNPRTSLTNSQKLLLKIE